MKPDGCSELGFNELTGVTCFDVVGIESDSTTTEAITPVCCGGHGLFTKGCKLLVLFLTTGSFGTRSLYHMLTIQFHYMVTLLTEISHLLIN